MRLTSAWKPWERRTSAWDPGMGRYRRGKEEVRIRPEFGEASGHCPCMARIGVALTRAPVPPWKEEGIRGQWRRTGRRSDWAGERAHPCLHDVLQTVCASALVCAASEAHSTLCRRECAVHKGRGPHLVQHHHFEALSHLLRPNDPLVEARSDAGRRGNHHVRAPAQRSFLPAMVQ